MMTDEVTFLRLESKKSLARSLQTLEGKLPSAEEILWMEIAIKEARAGVRGFIRRAMQAGFSKKHIIGAILDTGGQDDDD